MNTGDCEWKNSTRLAGFLCFVFTGLSIYSYYLAPNFNYGSYTVFRFHISKHSVGLMSWMLAMSMGRTWAPAYFPKPAKNTQANWLGCAIMWCSFLAIPTIPCILLIRQETHETSRAIHPTSAGFLGDISPLMMAAYKGDLQEIKRLIDNGANVNERNNVNNTALHFAAGAFPVQNLPGIQLSPSLQGESVLSLGRSTGGNRISRPNRIYRGSPAAVAYLIEHGAYINAEDGVKNTPLIDAVMNNNPAILEPNVIRSILTYLRLPDKPPDLAPAQIPDQAQFS
jgi:hypothetical protein